MKNNRMLDKYYPLFFSSLVCEYKCVLRVIRSPPILNHFKSTDSPNFVEKGGNDEKFTRSIERKSLEQQVALVCQWLQRRWK